MAPPSAGASGLPSGDRSRTAAPHNRAAEARKDRWAIGVSARTPALAPWPMSRAAYRSPSYRSGRAGWEAALLVGLVGLACLSCQASAARAREDAARPIEVIVASDPETLDPRYTTDAVGLRATRLVHAGLTRMDPDTLEPIPYAARGWRWLDAQTLRVELRDDVFFHSGARLAPRDVVETLRAMASPEVGSRHAGIVEAIGGAEADGPLAVVIRLARPHATLLADLELPILRADQAASRPAPDGSLDGLGPYVVAGTARGEVRLEPAERSALPRPLHAITLRTVHDENARALRLEAGRSDVALNVISPTLVPALATQAGLHVVARPGANLTYVVVQEERPPLDDARVRRAISLAIDRAMLCRSLLDGRAEPARGLIAPANWAHTPSPPFAFDAVASRALLDARGDRRRLTLLSSTERLRVDVARTVAQELGDVGVDVVVVPLELGTMLTRLGAGDFDLAILQLPEMTEPNVLRHFLRGSLAPPNGANRGRVRDSVLDQWLDAGDSEADPTLRRAIYAQVEARVREEMHLIPLWHEDQVAVTSDRAQSFVPSAEGRWFGLASLP
jgi:peptide/nickel transport system substrate-binding protein